MTLDPYKKGHLSRDEVMSLIGQLSSEIHHTQMANEAMLILLDRNEQLIAAKQHQIGELSKIADSLMAQEQA